MSNNSNINQDPPVIKQSESQKLDQQFKFHISQIEEFLPQFNKHQRIRVDLWIKKLMQLTTNFVWQQNRNLYSQVLLQMVKSQIITDPFIKVPPDGALPRLTLFDIPFQLREALNLADKENDIFNNHNNQTRNQSPNRFNGTNYSHQHKASQTSCEKYKLNSNYQSQNGSVVQQRQDNSSYSNLTDNSVTYMMPYSSCSQMTTNQSQHFSQKSTSELLNQITSSQNNTSNNSNNSNLSKLKEANNSNYMKSLINDSFSYQNTQNSIPSSQNQVRQSFHSELSAMNQSVNNQGVPPIAPNLAVSTSLVSGNNQVAPPQANQYLKLQAQLDTAKLNEKELKKQITIRLSQADFLTKNLEQSSKQLNNAKDNQDQMLHLIARMAKFLLNNSKLLENQSEYNIVLNEIYNVSKDLNITLGAEQEGNEEQIDSGLQSQSEQSEFELDANYQQYALQLKQQLNKTDRGTHQFLSYLEVIQSNIRPIAYK